MYVSPTFKTKKDFKDAIAKGQQVTVYAPGLGQPPHTGTCSVEGPSYKPHTWYAVVQVENFHVKAVK